MRIIECADCFCDVLRLLADHDVRAIPTVVLPDGRRIVGAVSLDAYRRAIAA